jgi:hypothetical protein
MVIQKEEWVTEGACGSLGALGSRRKLWLGGASLIWDSLRGVNIRISYRRMELDYKMLESHNL